MPDKDPPYPKQRIEDAIHRGLSHPEASAMRQRIRMGEHPYTAQEDRINYDRRERERDRVARLTKRSRDERYTRR